MSQHKSHKIELMANNNTKWDCVIEIIVMLPKNDITSSPFGLNDIKISITSPIEPPKLKIESTLFYIFKILTVHIVKYF